MKTFAFSCLGFILLLVLNNSRAFAQLEQTEAIAITATALDKNAKASTTKTYIDKDKVRIETSGGQQGSVMLFDAESETLYLIDSSRQEVTEMTREDIAAISSMLEQQMNALSKQLENLPEAQRKIMKERMEAAMSKQEAPAVYALEEKGVAVKSWTTDKYTGTSGKGKESEIYIASYKETGLEADDFTALEKFYILLKDFAGSMSRSVPGTAMQFLSESMPGYEKGIPVKSVLYNSNGVATYTLMVEKIEEEEVADTLFDVPENYKKKELKDLAGQE